MPNFSKDDTVTIIKKNTGSSSGLTGDRDDITRTTPAKGAPPQPAYNPLGGGSANTGKPVTTPVVTKPTTSYIPPSYTPTYKPPAYGPPAPAPVVVKPATPAPAPNYIPPSYSPTYKPPVQGPPAPTPAPARQQGPPAPSNDPFMRALQQWQSARPPIQQWQPIQLQNPAQQVGLSFPRPDTNAPGMAPTQTLNPTVQAPSVVATPQPFYDRAQDGLIQDRVNPWANNSILDAWQTGQPAASRMIGPVNQGPTVTGGLANLTPEDEARLRAENAPPQFGMPQWVTDAGQWLGDKASEIGAAFTPRQGVAPGSVSTFGPQMQLAPQLQPVQQAWQNSAAKEQMDYTIAQNNLAYANYKQAGLSDVVAGFGTWLTALNQNRAALAKEFGDYRAGESLGKSAQDYLNNMSLIGPMIQPFYEMTQLSRPTALAGNAVANLGARIQGVTSLGYNYPSLPGNTPPSAYIAAGADALAQEFASPTGINPFSHIWDDLVKQVGQYQAAVQPTPQQMSKLSPAELFKDQQRAFLNTLGGLQSVQNTFDALANRPDQIAALNGKAKENFLAGAGITEPTVRQMYWTEAAKAGAEAHRLQYEHPQAIVFENMNLPRQMFFEMLLPDVTTLAGELFKLGELTPKARRLTGVMAEVMRPEEKAIQALTEMAVGTENMAKVMAERSSYNKYLNLWTIGTARADIATDKMFRYTANLLNGVDTVGDARVLMQQLAADPAKLIRGVESKLFQSPDLLARAGESGLIKFGSMGLENIKEPLRIYQQAAKDFLKSAESLNKGGPLLNKVDFMAEFSNAMTEAGYKYFNVAGGQKSAIAALNQFRRNIVSVPYIFLSPGTWATNIVGGVSTALGDGVFSLKSAEAIDEHITKLFGVDPTMRGFEGIKSAQSFITEAAPGGVFSALKRAYGSIDEWTGKKVYHSAVTQALRKAGVPVLETSITPILNNLGMTSSKEIRQVANQLFESGYRGDNILTEFNKIITGNTRKFAISDINPHWLDAIPQQKLEEFYSILQKAPDSETAINQIRNWADSASGYWDELIAAAPPTAQRHVWQTKGAAQDMADITQAGKNAAKYGNVPAEQVNAWTTGVGAEFKAAQAKMETLAQMVADAGKPENRYVLYSIWGQVTDSTSKVRDELGQLAERIAQLPKEEREIAWAQEYFPKAQELWAGRNATVDSLLEAGSRAIAEGSAVAPNLDTWNILERTARQNEAKLWDALRLEPQSGTWDARLQQVTQAGRAITDKAMARVYAAARRFTGIDAMDHIISAEHNVQMAGAQARAYLDKVLETTLNAKKPNWENYFSIRNETWRQLRTYERDAWGLAERNIVREGLATERTTGLVFDAGADGVVELVGQDQRMAQRTNKLGSQTKVTQEPVSTWTVKRQDGTITTVPDAMVPPELKAKFKGLTPDQIDAETQLELDNIASAHPYADDAQKIINEQYTPPMSEYKTSKGSTYAVHEDGTTTRNKSFHPEHGTQDVGLQERSQTTFYVDKDGLNKLGEIKSRGAGRQIVVDQGSAAIKYTDGKDAGKIERRTVTKVYDKPVIGLYPVELWQDGKIVHFGNDITEVKAAPHVSPKIKPTGVGTPLQSETLDTLYQAREQIGGIEEARRTMRAEWDKMASAELGLPKLDTVVMQTNRSGVVQVSESAFEDLYGRTIAGYSLGNQADVEAFLSDYAAMRKQVVEANKIIEQHAASLNDLHAIANVAGIPTASGTGVPNNQYLLNVINKDRKAAGLRKITMAQLETDAVVREESATLLMNRIGTEGAPTIRIAETTTQAPSNNQLLDVVNKDRQAVGLAPVTWEQVLNDPAIRQESADALRGRFAATPEPEAPVLINLSKNLENADRTIINATQAGGTQAGELGLGAAHAKLQLKNLVDYLEQNIDNILKPVEKGAIGEGQSLRALDDFRKQVLPAWDNLKFASSEYGNRMRSFTLIDNLNKTRLDELLGLFMPYGFWTTRTMKNSLERAIFEPQIWSRVMKADRDIKAMVDQNGDPQRYSGAFPIDIGGGKKIYLNISPAKYWSAFGLFTQNDYADPESANNALSFGIEAMKSANLSPYPDIQAVQKILEGKANDLYPVSYTQQTRMLADIALMVSGSKVPALLFPGYFENTVARNLNNMAMKGQITEVEAKQAHDLMWQIKNGGKPLPEQANWDMARLSTILDQAYKTSAGDDLLAAASSWLTGVGVKPFDAAENTWRGAQDNYYGYQYGPDNPYGSHLASQSEKETASLNWSKNAVGKGEGERPGIQLATAEKAKMKDAINADLMQATESWLEKAKKTPSNKEINDFKLDYLKKQFPEEKGATFFADIIKSATDKAYPSAQAFEATPGGTYYKGWAPEEIRAKAKEAAVYQAKKDIRAPQWPGDGASKSAKRAYYADKENYDKAIEARADQLMKDPNAMAALAGMPLVVDYSKGNFDNAFGPTPWRPTGDAAEPLVGLVPLAGEPKNAAEQIKAIEQQYMGPLERAIRDANDAKAAGYGRGGGGGRRSSRRSSRRGGGGGGGYGGGGGGSSGFRWGTPIDPRYMQGNLWPDINYIQRWRPTQADLSWLDAGRRIGPGAIHPWKPIKV